MKLGGSKCRLIGFASRHDLEIISRFKMGGTADSRSFTVAMSTVGLGHNLATDEHTDTKLTVAEDMAARQLIDLIMAALPSPKPKQRKTHTDFAREGNWAQAVRSLCTERGWTHPTTRVTNRAARDIRATGKSRYNAAIIADIAVTVRIGSSSAIGHGPSKQEATAEGFRHLYHDLTCTT